MDTGTTVDRVVLFDVETDGIVYTKIHCISVKVARWAKPLRFTSVSKFEQWASEHTDKNTLWVAHNNCGYDFWVINNLTKVRILRRNAIDTCVLSKLKNFNKFNTHSLKELGEDLGVYKGEFKGPWEVYTEEMGDYCDQDVVVLEAIWNRLKHMLEDYPEACRIEHNMALIAAEIQHNGFPFDKEEAINLLDSVEKEMTRLEDEMQKQWPPKLVEDRRIQWRTKADGTPYATCLKAMDSAPKWVRDGDELILYRYQEFNPRSSKQRVEKLWEAGWKPFDKTKGHIEYERNKRRRFYK